MHVAETNARAKAIGGARFGEEQGLLVDGDLTSLDAAKAAVDADQSKKHVAEATFGERVKGSLELGESFDSTVVTGSDIDDFDTLLPDGPAIGTTPHARF